MTGHVLGVVAALVGLALATVAAVVSFGAAGAGVAALLWLGLGVLLVDVEALQR